MSYFDDFSDDLLDEGMDDFADDDFSDLMLVPNEVEEAGYEAVDNFIHNEVMKSMEKDVYNGS